MDGYRWVLAVLIANVALVGWMAKKVGGARRKFKVPYPIMYADEKEHKDAKIFNCVQRAHQNTLELLPAFMAALLVGGLEFPRTAAALGAIHFLARIQYFKNYSVGDPSKRFAGGGRAVFPALSGLLLFSILSVVCQFVPQLY